MEKEPGTKICGVLISFHEVMNLQSFELDVVTSYSRIYETFGFLSIFLLILYRENLLQSFLVLLTFFDGPMKLRRFE